VSDDYSRDIWNPERVGPPPPPPPTVDGIEADLTAERQAARQRDIETREAIRHPGGTAEDWTGIRSEVGAHLTDPNRYDRVDGAWHQETPVSDPDPFGQDMVDVDLDFVQDPGPVRPVAVGGLVGAFQGLSRAMLGDPDPVVMERRQRAVRRAERVEMAHAAQQYLMAAALAVVIVLLLIVGWRIL
jgi:hypothetical protein